VIDEDGTQLGVLSTNEARWKARDAGLDLVEVAPQARPPVCRIMDYGKYKYERSKNPQKAHKVKLKEIRLRPGTGDHDIEFKVKQAKQFLLHKDKVQLSMQFKGRENAHIEDGRKVLERVVGELMDVGKIESKLSHQGRRIICTIAPK
jgi:translation initiation factor IF-3